MFKHRSVQIARRVPGSLAARAPLSAVLLLLVTACGQATDGDSSAMRSKEAQLQLDPAHDSDGVLPADNYTLFEADPVRPLASLTKSDLILVTNTVSDSLDVLRLEGRRKHGRGQERKQKKNLVSCGRVKVGMRPVAVAVVEEKKSSAEIWVTNHLSDSVSIVQLDTEHCTAKIKDTLHVGDEPRDIVVSSTKTGDSRVFLTMAHRGQHHPIPSAQSGQDLVRAPHEKQQTGLGDVLVYDPKNLGAPLTVVNLFTDTSRALALGKGVVYAAGFHSGNGTTIVPAETAALRGTDSLTPHLARDAQGGFIEQDGELVLAPGVAGQVKMEGGMPAVIGEGRCIPHPKTDRTEAFTQQVCVQTDAAHNIQHAYVVAPGQANPVCQCTSGDGTPQPTVGVIVQFYSDEADCGTAYTTFPDGVQGCWLDRAPRPVLSPAAHRDQQASPMAWNEEVRLSLPDSDVFAIDVDSLTVKRTYSGVGTTLFALVAQPKTDKVFVLNTDAHNLTRFEGKGESSSSTVQGHLHESHITVLGPKGRVTPVHLNSHIDYGKCCDRDPQEVEASLAFPTSGAFSKDGKHFYFAALGSDKVAALDVSGFGPDFDNLSARSLGKLRDIYAGEDPSNPSGPVGVALSASGDQLYVKTHFSNEVIVIDTDSEEMLARLTLPSPEPASITRGRHVLYNARLTSAHGDSACASCHVFGDFDGLSWDLGDPDGPTHTNPGPIAVPPAVNSIPQIALDPSFPGLSPNFRANKGPMSTQTLRGMANHGAQHWRGDRTRNFPDAPGSHPNFGSLDEDNSFGEFDVAITGLNGNDVDLDPELFQDFTNFSLQLTLPPNPVRALDNTLTSEQASGRALFFGCASQTDEQYEQRQCTSPSGQHIDIDEEADNCACFSNIFLRVMDATPALLPFVLTIQDVLEVAAVRSQVVALASDPAGVPAEIQPTQQTLVAQLEQALSAFAAADVQPDQRHMIPSAGATALAQSTGALLTVLGFFQQLNLATGMTFLDFLLDQLPSEARQAGSPFETTTTFAAALPDVFGLANVTIRVQADEAARGTGAFENLLGDCEVSAPRSCDARITDSLQTCHGCHTLDPSGNKQFDAYRPGFFGTEGKYSFENESQVMKVPHLRNLYQKVGMFGRPDSMFTLSESIFGPEQGGFFAPGNPKYFGPQVRGSSFLHDGSMDTVHRFFGAGVFTARPAGLFGPFDTGNPNAFDAAIPPASSRLACVSQFRSADLSVLPPLEPELTEALEFCATSSGLPDSCFLDPATEECQTSLEQVGALLGMSDFATTFVLQLRPLCFQLGSTLEGGHAGGACYPQGLTERSNMEAFMMAFDSNLRPMVGQQVTLHGTTSIPSLLTQMLIASERGDCDIAAFGQDAGYVMTAPHPTAAWQSQLQAKSGTIRSLRSLARSETLTLTCYPPQASRAEAWAALL